MKSSPYNHFFAVNGGTVVLAYNSYSGAVAEIEPEHYPRVRFLLEHPDQAETQQDAEFLQCLQQGMFLIPDQVDQRAALKVIGRTARLDAPVLTLTIAPTLACNFACDYCFEARSQVMMSPATQEALVGFTAHHLRKAEALRICWFGGEPTLCMTLVERLQNQFLELAAQQRAGFVPSQIITNGYLLDAALARRLAALHIERAQITVDGPRAVHDSRRKLRNGRGTFDRVMDNITSAAEVLQINVRINVDRDNVASVYEVVEILDRRGVLPKVRITFGQIKASGHACADIRDRCYDNAEFADTLVQIQSVLNQKRINCSDYPRILGGAACGAVAEGYYVVSPTGHLFKCWEDISNDAGRSIGDLFSSQPSEQQQRNLDAYRNWDPFQLPGCRGCDVLPICMGGCPISGIEEKLTATGVCSPWKYNLERLLALTYQAGQQAAAQQA